MVDNLLGTSAACLLMLVHRITDTCCLFITGAMILHPGIGPKKDGVCLVSIINQPVKKGGRK
jgi:hypothetical protein